MAKWQIWRSCILFLVLLGLFGHFAVEAICVAPGAETVIACQTQASNTTTELDAVTSHTGFVPPLHVILYLPALVSVIVFAHYALPIFAVSPLLPPPINQ